MHVPYVFVVDESIPCGIRAVLQQYGSLVVQYERMYPIDFLKQGKIPVYVFRCEKIKTVIVNRFNIDFNLIPKQWRNANHLLALPVNVQPQDVTQAMKKIYLNQQ